MLTALRNNPEYRDLPPREKKRLNDKVYYLKVREQRREQYKNANRDFKCNMSDYAAKQLCDLQRHTYTKHILTMCRKM